MQPRLLTIYDRIEMTDFDNASLTHLIIHRVGNKGMEEGVTLSDEPVDLSRQQHLETILKNYFLNAVKNTACYQFHHVSALALNEVWSIASGLFQSVRSFRKKSKDLANILYEYSSHPKIKSGELYIAYFEDCVFRNETTDAIGIFKSENTETFLKILDEDRRLEVRHDTGISVRKPDKACLIFNTCEPEGFRVFIPDGQSSSQEAQYWKDEFLKLKPVDDNYFQTQQYLSMAKNFVTERLEDEFEVSRADQIDYLNRSIGYFKKNEQFNEQDFATDVFGHQEVISSFKKFKREYQDEESLNVVSEFEISAQAVRKQARVFKSVLKLDRNFHVYIHGDKDQIEKGVDPDGRKYYKLYYREES